MRVIAILASESLASALVIRPRPHRTIVIPAGITARDKCSEQRQADNNGNSDKEPKEHHALHTGGVTRQKAHSPPQLSHA
jgi:hypothetical protein